MGGRYGWKVWVEGMGGRYGWKVWVEGMDCVVVVVVGGAWVSQSHRIGPSYIRCLPGHHPSRSVAVHEVQGMEPPHHHHTHAGLLPPSVTTRAVCTSLRAVCVASGAARHAESIPGLR
eukprot:gene8943-biopygen15209